MAKKSAAALKKLGPSTRAIVDAARRRGIPWMRLSDENRVQLGCGRNKRFVHSALACQSSAIACDIARDKRLTKAILRQASIPVPRAEFAQSEDEAVAAFEQISPPVAVKPLDSSQGRGVSLNITTAEQVKRAFHVACEHSSSALVEEMLAGRDYRVLVVNGEMVAASERRPPRVIGNGQHAIAELIEIENKNPLRGRGHEKPLTRITIDSILIACLEKRGLSLDNVPDEGEVVALLESANLSTGGTAIDVTDTAHPDVARLCERAARAVGLDICGVDLILKDISQPLTEGAGGIIELNAAPSLRMHLYPSEGKPRDVGAKIVEMLYPAGSSSRAKYKSAGC